MLPITPLEAEYQKLLFQMKESRKQYRTLCNEVELYQNLNSKSRSKIEELEKLIEIRLKENFVNVSDSNSIINIENSISFDSPRDDRAIQGGTSWQALDSTYQTTSPEDAEAKNTLFEYFFVIETDPEKARLGENKPKICFSYPKKIKPEYKKLSKELKNLIFPSKINGENLDEKENKMDQISYVLYKSRERDENSFIITFDPIDPGEAFMRPDMINNLKRQLYCCCLKFQDISAEAYEKQLMVVSKSYCFLTYIPCFDLHFDILDKLLLILRAMISEKSKHQLIYFETYNDFELIFGNSEEGLGLLESYHEYYSDGQVPLFSDISMGLQTAGFIDYQFPDDCYYLDKKWTCSLVFSILSLHELWFLIRAVMVDARILIVSSDLGSLTSCVLGLQSLILPLPRSEQVYSLISNQFLKVLINSSESFLSGVASISQEEISAAHDVLIVQINEKHNQIWFNGSLVNVKKVPSITYSLVEKIKDDYALFNSEHLYKRSKDVRRKEVVYSVNDEQAQAQEKIIEEIRKFVLWVVNELKTCWDCEERIDVQAATANLKDKASLGNQEFFCQVLTSKLFAEFLESKN